MTATTFERVPGLYVYLDHFDPGQCARLVRRSLELYERLRTFVALSTEVETAHIPQPEFVRSTLHNLASEEHYTRVVLEEANERPIRCEYFPRYGEEGHALCYFRGNENLPDCIREGVLGPIQTAMEAARLVPPDRALAWKLTMNFYHNVGGTVAGFPFHVDIPANGVVTMILNVHNEALFQIARDEAVQDVALPVGSLLVLSGESRYLWKHRVVPMLSAGTTPLGEVERVSLVLGFQ
jgi:hypothetical protein